MPHRTTRLLAAALVACLAFALYHGTLLPGQDLGDTASFQAIAGERVLTPRQGYPLYFAVAGLFVHAMPDNPARATNLASAVEGALAAGLLVLVGAELGGTLVAGVVGGLLLAGSYTYWSQAIIAEVYALHALIIGLCLLALLHWRRRPTTGRLALFFALCALGFGNHLQMVLLLPAFALFLLVSAPGGPLSMLRPRVVLLALGLAALFSLQYSWNFASLLFDPAHDRIPELLKTFWFDVTKSDWRENMVATIPWSRMDDRLAMYWWDLRQQVGTPGVAAAIGGLAFLFRTDWRAALLVTAGWLVNWAFAFTYNVGDAHVFFLPSHLFVALAAGCGAGLLWHAARWHLVKRSPGGRLLPAPAAVLALALLAYPAHRIWDTYPAMDRSEDRAPADFLDWLTGGLTGDREIFGREIIWQLHNGLDYYEKYTKPGLALLDTSTSMLHFPFIAWRNAEMGRDVVLTEGAATLVREAYGTLLPIERDARLPVPRFSERLQAVPAGTPYVLAVMDSYPETPLDPADMWAAAARLGLRDGLPRDRYLVVAGRVGDRPQLVRSGQRPFRASVLVGDLRVDARIESWVPADTIRRMGFGHVIVDRRHVLTMDRGASFVALAADGSPRLTAWYGGLYTPQPRYVIRADAVRR